MVQRSFDDFPTNDTIADLKADYNTVVGLVVMSLNSGNTYLIVEATDEGVNVMALIHNPPERTPGVYALPDSQEVRVMDREYMRTYGAPFKWNAIAARYPAVQQTPQLKPPPG